MSMAIGSTPYFYVRNAQNDIIGLVDSTGTQVVKYSYDSWGNCTVSGSQASGAGAKNPFRYRGYYYDRETGLYYLKNRYYDPEIKRFLSPDAPEVLTAAPMALSDKNLYAYCDNNPVVRVDGTGTFWETVFDLVSFGFSIAEVIANPYDPMAWAGLAGDAIDLIPVVTGVGETVRGLRFVDKAGNTLEIAKAVDLTDTAKDTAAKLHLVEGITKSTRTDGIKIHNGYKYGSGFVDDYKEYKKVSGIRPDYYDVDANIIYELKPYNPRAARAGIRQLQKYNKVLGRNSVLCLEFY